ncbi:SpoIID/LytB domain-containing protein [Trichocoleus sp. FACHB-591]|uniref:SpoIID/LytB domain-containing protein n=1 Tax=Trichocoleus sp. FACHB-591 TaxID=2692872 RepID=UPI001687DCE0|nr:SpoIID/LytB domain-containing protein [Trichocoleus sp. FACHB-591]MBD2096494.1 SpoIID/LytB domain-containing protein [Trichocoleus sp. FACHB-591]
MTSGHTPAFLIQGLRHLVRLGGRHWWVSALIWLAMIAPAQAALDLRVAVEEGKQQVGVASSTKALIKDGNGRILGELAPEQSLSAALSAGGVSLQGQWQAGQIWVEPTGGGYVWIGDRWYRGRAFLVPTAKGLTAVNYVDLEQYLYSVVAAEMIPSWPQEALKAQAIAARSYALYQRQSSANSVYDVGDTQAWQVYEGVAKETSTTQAAVNATAGQVLTHSGRIIEAVFHSSSGGHTENVEDVWKQPLPYLRGVQDYDQGAPVYQWTKTFSNSELSNRISGVGNVISMQPARTTPQGRIVTMKVVGDAGSRTISGSALRDALGLRSTLFTATAVSGSAGTKSSSSLPGFQISGRGFGHGLGMSQWGAHNLAQRGYNYQQIVLHYYKGTALARIQVQ